MPHKEKVKSVYHQIYHQEHKDKIHIRQHNYYATNRDDLLSRSKDYNVKNKEKQHKYNQEYANNFKIEVLTHYGNGKLACTTCGESRKDCLSIGHINGGGNKHRRDEKLYGNKIYRWLKKNNFPIGYQTLCMNCQFIKRINTKGEWDNKRVETL